MLTGIYHVLRKQPVMTLFLILGLGYLIGGLRIRGDSLGSVAGVVLRTGGDTVETFLQAGPKLMLAGGIILFF